MQTFSVRIPDELHEQLRDHVHAERATLQDVCSAALRAYLRGAPVLKQKVSARESDRLTVALDLMRRGPLDLKKLFNHLLDFWDSEGAAR